MSSKDQFMALSAYFSDAKAWLHCIPDTRRGDWSSYCHN
jgi:hypothetical protein